MCINLNEADFKMECYSYINYTVPTRCSALWHMNGKNRGHLKNTAWFCCTEQATSGALYLTLYQLSIPAKAAKPLCDTLALRIMVIKRCHDAIPGLPSECSRDITQVIYWRKEKRSTLWFSLYPSPSIHTYIFDKEELWTCVHNKIWWQHVQFNYLPLERSDQMIQPSCFLFTCKIWLWKL